MFSFRVRTTETRAFLFFVGDKSLGADNMFFLVRIVDGHVTIRLRNDFTVTSKGLVNDGVWHNVLAEVTDEGKATTGEFLKSSGCNSSLKKSFQSALTINRKTLLL